MADLSKVIRSWAAGREGVSQLEISHVEFDFDKGWPGTDVTPGDMPEIVIKYRVHRDVIYRREVTELGDFISELAISVANKGTIVAEPATDEISTTDEIEIDIPGRGKIKCHALFVSPLQNLHYGDSMPFALKINDKPIDIPNVAYVIVTPA
jgi:hypothetical protein